MCLCVVLLPSVCVCVTLCGVCLDCKVGVNIGASTKKALVATGVSFPVSDDAMAALEKFKSGTVNYVQMVYYRCVCFFFSLFQMVFLRCSVLTFPNWMLVSFVCFYLFFLKWCFTMFRAGTVRSAIIVGGHGAICRHLKREIFPKLTRMECAFTTARTYSFTLKL